MRDLWDAITGILAFLSAGTMMAVYALVGIGGLYWLWMAIQLSSFAMFCIGLFPLFYIITGPIGAWSLLFGMPDWIYDWFG